MPDNALHLGAVRDEAPESPMRCSAERSGKSGNTSDLRSGCVSKLEGSRPGFDVDQRALRAGHSVLRSGNGSTGSILAQDEQQDELPDPEERVGPLHWRQQQQHSRKTIS